MSTDYTYFREIYDVNGLFLYIKGTLSSITGITYDSGTITTTFSSALSTPNKTVLDGLILSYSNPQVLLSNNQYRLISVGNSTSTTLSAGAIFTGSFEDVSDYSSITCVIFTDVTSASAGFVFQFSTDGINVDYSQSYIVPPNGDTHVSTVLSRYFRVRYTNGATQQAVLRLQCIYHHTKTTVITSTISTPILSTSDAGLTKAVLVGKQSTAGPYANVTLNNLNELSIDIPRTAFGEVAVANMTPVIQYDFTYCLNSDVVITSTTGSGSVVHDGTVFVNVASGSAINSSGAIWSRRFLRYKPGQGARAVFSCIYTQGVDGNTQVSGVGTDLDGYFIGYNGTTFSILRRYNGTNNWTAQSSWNYDKMDGTGSSGIILDPTKGNIYMINYQWYGFGSQNYYISDPTTGRFVLVHRITYENQYTLTSTLNNILPMYLKSTNTTNNTNIIMKSSSFAAFVEGNVRLVGPRYGIDASKLVNSTLFTPIITIRNRTTYNSKTNYIPVYLRGMSVCGNNSQPIIVVLFRNSTLTGTSFTNINTINSVIESDTSATAITGGSQIHTMCLDVNGSINYDLSNNDLILVPGEYVTIAVRFLNPGNAYVGVGLNWYEEA